MYSAEYSKKYRKELDDERKQLRKDTYNKKRRKAIHCSAKELQNVINMVNKEFNLYDK